jgi:hypothetical protein
MDVHADPVLGVRPGGDVAFDDRDPAVVPAVKRASRLGVRCRAGSGCASTVTEVA